MDERDKTTKSVKMLRSGRITIPVEFRRRLEITEESALEMSVVAGELHLRAVEMRRSGAGSQWFKDLYAMYAPVRHEAIEHGYTEDDINAAINAGFAAVRAYSV